MNVKKLLIQTLYIVFLSTLVHTAIYYFRYEAPCSGSALSELDYEDFSVQPSITGYSHDFNELDYGVEERLRSRIQGGAAGDVSVAGRLRSTFPEIKTNSVEIKRLGASGLFEITYEGVVFLITQDGNYLINHSYVDLTDVTSRRDISKAKEMQLNGYYAEYDGSNDTNYNQAVEPEKTTQLSSQDKSSTLAITDFEWVKKNSIPYLSTNPNAKDIVVFSDYTCPYCRKFHEMYEQLNQRGYNVFVALISRQGTQGRVFEQTQYIQCSENRKALYEQAIQDGGLYGAVVADTTLCSAPAATMYNIALQQMEQPATPGIWLEGKRFITIAEANRL